MSDWRMIHNNLLVPLYLEELLRIDQTAQVYFQSFPRSCELAITPALQWVCESHR